jgi:predicted transglutaminase-like cysteine proteinase
MRDISVMATSDRTGDCRAASKARNWMMLFASLAAAMTFDVMPAFGFLTRPILFAAVGGVTKAPAGWLQFCADNPDECRTTHETQRDVTLTPDGLQQLFSINAYANDRVRWTSDSVLYGRAEHWAYPLDRGDCEDIVLLKRRLLAQAGWPIGALLITTVEERKGDAGHHAVLTVRTDRGELILDSQTPEILFWYETNYRFLARQSTSDPNIWLAFSANQPRPAPAGAAAP